MRPLLIASIALLLFSCGKKQEGHISGHDIKLVEATPVVVPADSLELPIVYSTADARITQLPVNKSTVIPPTNNVRLAGKPVMVKAGSPTIRIPGQDSCLFPTPVVAADSSFIAGEHQVEEARAMGRKEINSASVSFFSKLEGLKHDEVWSILEDRAGNIWFGTNRGGATRYDGKYFTHFTTKEGLASDQVQCITEDRKGNIWFGTTAGVTKYDGKTCTNFTAHHGLGGDAIQSIIEDYSGNIWFGIYDGGVTKYDGKNFYRYTTENGLCSNNISCVFQDNAANVWFGSFGGGVTRYNGKTFATYTTQEGLGSDVILCIQQDLRGNIWFGSAGGGVTGFDGTHFTTYTTEQGLIDNIIGFVEVDHLGNLWFASQSGVCSFDGVKFTAYTTENGLTTNLVYILLEDRSGNVWAATGGGGICRIGGVNFMHLTTQDGLAKSTVYSMLEEPNGNRWFGTEDGLIRLDSNLVENFRGDDESSIRFWIHSIGQDKTGKIWLGLDMGGFVWYDGTSFNKLSFDEQFESITITAVFEDLTGTLWFGSSGKGVFRYDGKNFTRYTTKSGLCNDNVKCIIEDGKGNVWFGSEGGGVSRFNGREFENFGSKNGLTSDLVHAMLEDRWGNIWVGTESGLCRYDGKAFAQFTTRDGLSNDAVFSLWEDRNAGDLWIGTRMGICRVSTERIEEKFRNNAKPFLIDDEVLFKIYNIQDGFLGIGCNRGAIQRMSDGRLWLGANSMVTAINTGNLQFDIIAPTMSLVGLDLFNEKVSWQSAFAKPDSAFDLSNGVRVKNFHIDSLSHWYGIPKGLSLAYDNNNLTFRYTGITMHQPGNVRYRYKLNGFDKDWSAITSQNTAPYGNLPAGTYTFMVKSMNSEGVWSEPLEYTFTIRPPWWRTWWAYALDVLLFLLLLTIFLRWRDRAAIANRKMLEQKITEATKEIRSQKEEVEKQKQRSDDLLLNILPEQVAEELKARGEAEARLIDNATVLFTDFKGFTQLSEKLSPQLLVSQIHEYFSAFDAIISKYGIEKIKTIGDSYMAAGGLPVPNETHPYDVVSAAIEINQFMEEQRRMRESKGESFFEIRIGVHTGPVVAGIVGVKKFQYDIWGDTVNTASRMESAGQPGKINISEKTYELVKDHFKCEYRGEIEAKGKQKMKMYFVLGVS